MTSTKSSLSISETPLTRRKRALVVGASSGIGAAIVHRLAQEGYVVAALARRGDMLAELCQHINAVADETRALPFQHDAEGVESIPAAFQQVLAELGSLDAVVYAAGVMPPVAIDEFSFEKDRQMLDINLRGAVAWLGQAAALFQTMAAGQIVGISSVAGDRGRVLNPAYGASKAGLDAYLESLRNRLTRHGVHVLTVRPGRVDTDMLETRQPAFIVVSPERVAEGVWKAMRRRDQLVYLPWYWRWVMLAVRLVPSFVFRRLSF